MAQDNEHPITFKQLWSLVNQWAILAYFLLSKVNLEM